MSNHPRDLEGVSVNQKTFSQAIALLHSLTGSDTPTPQAVITPDWELEVEWLVDGSRVTLIVGNPGVVYLSIISGDLIFSKECYSLGDLPQETVELLRSVLSGMGKQVKEQHRLNWRDM